MSIKGLIMDVDGTLTDGKVYIGENGELFKAFDIKDGYGINVLLPEHNITPIIITGRKSIMLERRCEEIGIKQVYQGINDKPNALRKVMKELGVAAEEMAYIGDDLNDISCMELCGMVGCPNDAVEQVKEISDYICMRKGGNGAVREFIEFIVSRE